MACGPASRQFGRVMPRDVRPPHNSAPAQHLGEVLRRWRTARRLSQLDLALQASTSTRHVSFLETGRAQPSREMVTRLADALTIPLRDRNALLIAAGYAPLYRQTDLGTPDMALARRAVEFMLRQQEPYPGIVVDRHWNLVLANQGAASLLGYLLDGPPVDSNLLRLVFRPDGLRKVMSNWEDVAGDMVRRSQQQLAWAPDDATLESLLSEVLGYPGVPSHWRAREPGAAPTPLLTVVLSKGEWELRFFSILATFGHPHDITLEELHVECSFPADEATAQHCQALAQQAK